MKTAVRNYLLIASVASLFVLAGVLNGGESQKKPNPRDHTVTTKAGKTVHVTVRGKTYVAELADGTYDLTNGGSIRVKDGVLVWDAFGAVERLRNGTAKEFGDPPG